METSTGKLRHGSRPWGDQVSAARRPAAPPAHSLVCTLQLRDPGAHPKGADEEQGGVRARGHKFWEILLQQSSVLSALVLAVRVSTVYSKQYRIDTR